MSFVSRGSIIESIYEIRDSVEASYRESRLDDASSDSISARIQAISELASDFDWVIRYSSTEDGWSHVENLDDPNNFALQTLIGVTEMVVEPETYNFIYENADRYFSQKVVRLPELDYFYVDFVVAVSYRAIRKKLNDDALADVFPGVSSAIEKWDGQNWSVLALYLLKKTALFVSYIAIAAFLALIAIDGNIVNWIVLFLFLAYSPVRFYKRCLNYQMKLKNNHTKLCKIKKMYELLSDGVVRWRLLAEDLRHLRAADIDLPLVLIKAVDARCISADVL